MFEQRPSLTPQPPPPPEPDAGTASDGQLGGRRWPFLVGFAGTGMLFMSVARTVTDEDVKKSKMVNPYQH